MEQGAVMVAQSPKSQPSAGFREIEHTADWALEVWAPTWPELLEQAARGMYALLRVRPATAPLTARPLHLQALDRAGLLVDFLSELLFWLEVDRWMAQTFHLQATATHLRGRLRGGPVQGQEKEIKAVTYHAVQVTAEPPGWRARVTFDV